ncbi:MAG: hypothetical protein QQN41_12180 [Nitrosopumilus sp.]
MKTTFGFIITKPGGGTSALHKTIDSPFAIYEGMAIYDDGWENAKAVTNVSFTIEQNLQDSCLNVELENETARDAKDQQSLVDNYKDYGWTEI